MMDERRVLADIGNFLKYRDLYNEQNWSMIISVWLLLHIYVIHSLFGRWQ